MFNLKYTLRENYVQLDDPLTLYFFFPFIMLFLFYSTHKAKHGKNEIYIYTFYFILF